VPSDPQRRLVAQLIGLHVTWEEIRQLVINPTNGEPVCKQTLSKVFRRELAAGGAELKRLAATKYFAALSAGESWAIRMAMRNASDGSPKVLLPCPSRCSASRVMR
jgi:hypothetical protein